MVNRSNFCFAIMLSIFNASKDISEPSSAFLTQRLTLLEDGITSIISRHPMRLSYAQFSSLYTAVYDFCTYTALPPELVQNVSPRDREKCMETSYVAPWNVVLILHFYSCHHHFRPEPIHKSIWLFRSIFGGCSKGVTLSTYAFLHKPISPSSGYTLMAAIYSFGTMPRNGTYTIRQRNVFIDYSATLIVCGSRKSDGVVVLISILLIR